MHVRCPHCQNAIEIVGDDDLTQVTCPSCGSAFNLLPTTASFSPTVRTIGHFTLLEQLGSGGFGTVWKAKDTRLDRLVAVKVPHRDQVDPAKAELFLREARATAQLRHANIVAVHEVGRSDDTLYIVSDFIQGVTLADRLTAGPFPPREAAELLARIAEALHHAHEAGVIHRDLKPQNIMLDADGQPHIMDFGLAKREAGEITMTVDGKILGTPAWMSPEQAQGLGHSVDPRTDVYSLGVILFQLLTHELPFRGNRAMLIHQVIHEEPPSPRKLNSRIPRDLETITLKCLEKDPRRRYATAADVAAELNRWLAGQSILARPVSRIERGIRWARRNPLVAGLSAAVALSLLAGTVVSTWFAFNASVEAAATRAEAKRAYYNYYIMQMNFAHRDWKKDAIASLHERLLKTTPEFTGGHDFRGFEWYYLDSLPHRPLRTVNGPGRAVGPGDFKVTCAISYDGTKVVSADFENAKVWDAATGREQATLKGYTGYITALDFDRSGMRIVTCSSDKALKIWDSSTGQALVTLKGSGADGNCVAFSSNRVVSGRSDETVRVWDAVTGNEVHALRGHKGSIDCVAFSPDGTRIASGGSDKTIKVWDAATGRELLTFSQHENGISSVVFSPDGKLIASNGFGTIKIWDALTGREAIEFVQRYIGFSEVGPGGRACLAFSSDSSKIAGNSGDGLLTLWDAVNGRELITYHGVVPEVMGVAFSGDDAEVVSITCRSTLNVWNALDGTKSLFMESGYKKSKLPVTPDPYAAMNQCDAIDPDTNRVIGQSINGQLRMWDAATGRSILSYSGLDGTRATAVSANRKRVAGADESQIIVWDVVTGHRVRTVKATGISYLAISPNGEQIVSNGEGSTLKVLDVGTGREVATMSGHAHRDHSMWSIFGGSANCLAYSPDGKHIVSGGTDQIVRVWDAETGREVLTLEGHQDMIHCVAFSPDNKRIVSGGNDRMLKVWEVASGRELLTLLGHAHSVDHVAIHPSGDRIASSSSVEFKLWDATTGQEIVSSDQQANVLAFNREGTRLIIGGRWDGLAVWDATPRDRRKMLPLLAK